MATKQVKGKVKVGGEKAIRIKVTNGRLEVKPEVQVCDKDTTEVEFIWTIKTPGWYFTLDGIDIQQGDYAMQLLYERDRRLIDRLAMDRRLASHPEIHEALMAAHARIVNPRQSRAKQFVNPRRKSPTEFRWNDLNDYWDVFLYQVNVTNGKTTLSLDPAIENEGC